MSTDLEPTTGGQVVSAHRLPHDSQTGGSPLNDWSALRDRATDLHAVVADGHHAARHEELNQRTLAIALQDPHDLVTELADRGLSWATIARLVGVSSTAVRKWRRGEPISGESRRKLASAVAFLDLIASALSPLEDACSWLEMPLADGATVTAADIYAGGGADILLDWAGGRLSPDEMLDAFDRDWRSHFAADDRFRIDVDDDGIPMIAER
jgi:transcriptional regulator with XRE-family HTH domain